MQKAKYPKKSTEVQSSKFTLKALNLNLLE